MSKPNTTTAAFRSSLRKRWSLLFSPRAGTLGIVLLGLVACTSTGGAPNTAPVAERFPSANSVKQQASDAHSMSIQELSVREESGQTVLFLKLSQPISAFRHFSLSQPSRIVVDLLGEFKAVPQNEIFRIDTTWVSAVRLSVEENKFRLIAEIAAAKAPEYVITPESGGLKLVIGAYNEKTVARKSLILVRNAKRTDARGPGFESTSSSEPLAKSSNVDQSFAPEKNYTGQQITLDFKDADIKNVFRVLGEISGKNIVITDDVNRRVTIRLVEVPWDQALDLLVDTNGLAKEEVGNVMRISTAARITREKRDLQDARKAAQSAEIPQISYLNVNYAKAKELSETVKQLIKGGAQIVPDDRSNFIVVRGTKKDLEEVVEIVGRLDVRTPQVLIESNLIETTPTFSRALGIEMDTLFNNGRVQSSTRFRADAPFTGTPIAVFPPNTSPIIVPSNGFRFGYFGNNVAGVLSAAEEEGNLKIVSRPSVVTLNNVESTIESSETIRVKTSAATVGESGSIQTFKAGIILTVTPQVSSDGFVLLKMSVKNSAFDFSKTVDNIPRETAREAKANILIRDGETVVIGGIMKDTRSNSDSGVPYLKDIPVLGWLFKKNSWAKNFDEMVVFITPRIIAAGSENLPTAEQLWRDQLKKTDGDQLTSPSSQP